MQTSSTVIAEMQSHPHIIPTPADSDPADSVAIRRPMWGYESPQDGLAPCDFCHNLRKVQVDAFPGDPLFGKWIPCPKCKDIVTRAKMQQRIREQRERIGHYSQLTGRALRQTFDTFDLREDEPNTEGVRRGYRTAHAFAQNPTGWLILYGACGTGKSHLAAAIANHLTSQKANGKKPPMVLFMTVPSALNLLRSGFDRGDHAELLLLTKEVDVLILDDLGVEKPTGWVQETLYEIINARYQAELPLVIVSNFPPGDLAPRLYDRLADNDLSTVVQMNAPTYRQRNHSPGEVISRKQ